MMYFDPTRCTKIVKVVLADGRKGTKLCQASPIFWCETDLSDGTKGRAVRCRKCADGAIIRPVLRAAA